MLAGLTQRVAELLVLGNGLRQLALGLEQSFLEGAHALGRVGQLAPQTGDLVFEELDLLAQLHQLGLVGLGHAVPPSRSAGGADR